MNKSKDELIARIDERLQAFIEQHDKDRAAAKDRIAAENEEKNQWRSEMMEKFQNLENKMGPVIKDHELIVKSGKWIVLAGTTCLGVVKGWFYIKDHIK